jgi:hypothetical protein
LNDINPFFFSAAPPSAAQVFAAAVSEFDSKTYLKHHNPGATVPLFILYLFIVSIIMLNLLIALLTNSYEKVPFAVSVLVSPRLLFVKIVRPCMHARGRHVWLTAGLPAVQHAVTMLIACVPCPR